MCREALEERVQTLWKLRTTHQFPSGSGFRVGIVFVAMKSNVHELPEVLDVARRLHADRALISNLLPYSVGMSRESLFCRSLWNVGDSGLQIRMARMDPSGGAAELVAGAMRPQDAIDSAPREYRDPLNTCPFVTAGSMSVRWDGSISPCLPLLRSHVAPIGHLWRRSAECAFGSLRDRGLLEIWELPEFVEFRQRVTRWDFPHCPSCGGCELAEANRTDCLGSPFPTCGGCLWAQGLILCP
jgi:MoaA/NifB/PqqE/SkfB family radical SAM enzyme